MILFSHVDSLAGFVIVHNLLKIKSKLSQIKIQLTHKLSHQKSEAAFEHLGLNIFSLQEFPSISSPLGINTPRGGRGNTGSYVCHKRRVLKIKLN